MPKTKKCHHCKKRRGASKFCKDKYSKDNLYYICKECDRDYQKRWRDNRRGLTPAITRTET